MCALSAQQNAMKYIISYLIFFISGIYYGEQRIGSAGKHVSPVHIPNKHFKSFTYLRLITTNDWKYTVKTVFQNKKS